MSIKRGGHTFAGYDKPIRTPNHADSVNLMLLSLRTRAKTGSLGSASRVLRRNVRAKVRVLLTKLSANRSRHATPKTSRRAKHLPHFGRQGKVVVKSKREINRGLFMAEEQTDYVSRGAKMLTLMQSSKLDAMRGKNAELLS